MKYQYKSEWYEGTEVLTTSRASEDSGKDISAHTVKFTRRGITATLAALTLCVSASYMANGIIGADGMSADAALSDGLMPWLQGSVSTPMNPSNADASYVMSWVYDDGMGGGVNDTDGGEDGKDSIHKGEKNESVADGYDAHIRELAEAYIAEHTPGGGS